MPELHRPAVFAAVLSDPPSRSPDARVVARCHSLDLTAVYPRSLADSPHEKVRRFARHQLPRLLAESRRPA